jgi:hypothetical protein
MAGRQLRRVIALLLVAVGLAHAGAAQGRLIGGAGPTVQSRLRLFSDRNFIGETYTLDSSRASLPGTVTHARSALVDSGRWQLCARRAFRPPCVVLSSSAQDLRSIGLHQIGSARPR